MNNYINSEDTDVSKIRLAKKIAESGATSRREAERLIESGRVKVNGIIITTPVFFVSPSDTILLDEKTIFEKSNEVKIWKFYKPNGVITSKNDSKRRPTVFDYFAKYFGRENRNSGIKRDRLLYIGRLDFNSEGLLLFTNNGDLARKMELPKTSLKRTYRVRFFGKLSDENKDKIRRGEVIIRGIKYAPAEILEEESNIDNPKNKWLKLVLREGKNREIRKIMEHFGCLVNRLIRTEYGPFKLEGMLPGQIEPVRKNEVLSFLNSLNFF